MTEAERLHHALGQRFRDLRRARPGLTQERLAYQAGVHPVFVSRVERGTTAVTVDTVAVLCTALDVSIAEFFTPFTRPAKLRGPRRRRR